MSAHASCFVPFRRGWILAAVLAALGVPRLAAAQGLSIGWQDCRSGSGTGSPDATIGCTASINSLPLFPAVRLASPIDSIFAMELVIDVDVATDVLPPWWHMEAGGCRQNDWGADAAKPFGCSDAWAGAGVASVQGWIPGTPGGSSRHARLLVAAGLSPGPAPLASLQAGVSYSVCRVLLREENPSNCDGCTIPACLVFNSLLLRRLPGSSVEEIFLSDPETAASNMLTWQGAGADCQSVPIRRRTWGAVKALYR